MNSVSVGPAVRGDEGIRVPRQDRSIRNMERMLAAAEELLNAGAFEDATVEQIVTRADTSVGAFYSRFRSKDALFTALQVRSLEHTRHVFLEALRDHVWDDLTLAEFLLDLLTVTASHYRKHRGVLRTLSLQARLSDKTWVSTESERINTEIYRLMVESLLCWHSAIGAQDPERAIRLAITVASSTLREVIVYARPGLSPVTIDDHELVEELVRVFLACLNANGEARCDGEAARELLGRFALEGVRS